MFRSDWRGSPHRARFHAPPSTGPAQRIPLEPRPPEPQPRLRPTGAVQPSVARPPEPERFRPLQVVDDDPGETAKLSEKEALKRALADLQAAEGRVARDAERVYDETRAKLIRELFPVLDNLDRTLAASGDDTAPLVAGVRMVRLQLEQVLTRFGVERIDAKGEQFDPSVHEAIATVPAESADVGRVVEEVEAGYRYGGKLLRAARVVVGAPQR